MIGRKGFSTKEVWSILCSCVLAMGSFTRNDLLHYTLNPHDIVLNGEGNVKIVPMEMSQFGFDYSVKKDFYYSPEMLKALKCTTPLALNNKSGVFTLGVTMLHLINLKPMNFLYDLDQMEIDFTGLNRLVQNVCDDEIRHILKKMMKVAPYERITFTELEDMLYGILENRNTQAEQVSRLEDSIYRVEYDGKSQKKEGREDVMRLKPAGLVAKQS